MALIANDLFDSLSRRFDQRDETHRLVIRSRAVHHGLPGEARAQIALRSGHDGESADNIVVNFAAASINVGVDHGKIMFHVDAWADELRSGENNVERSAGGVMKIVVGM